MNKPIRRIQNKNTSQAQASVSHASPVLSEIEVLSPIDIIKKQITLLKSRLDRRNIKVSKVAEATISYFEQYLEYDYFFVPPECANPWISDNPEFWEQEKQAKEISARRVKRWAFSLKDLLQDPVGRGHFIKFLDKEFSGENLK